jgi:hypothetical protein
MSQVVAFLEPRCDDSPWLVAVGVVTGVVVGGVVVTGGVVTGVVVTGGELDAAPLEEDEDEDEEAPVVLDLAVVVDVELVELGLLTLAASNGSRV